MNIINYKKPALWVAIASIIFVVAISAGVLLNSEEDNLLENTATPGTTEYQIIDTINSVKDQDDRQKIITLCFTTAFGGESGSDTPAPNNELSSKALLDIVNKLAALSGEDLDMEISREVKASIEKNIENPNIQWDRHFIETIVKTYCPEYYDRMIKIVDSYEGGGN